MDKSDQIGSLTGLRAVGALLVVFYHFYQYQEWPLQPVIETGGYLGVSLFFVLSGYILCHVYARLAESGTIANWRDFLIRRVARLYPLHIFMLAAMFVLLPHWGEGANIWDLLANLTMTQAWWSDRLTNIQASWSISVEFFCYLVFPAILLVRHGHWATIVFVAVATLHVLVALGVTVGNPLHDFASRRLVFYGSFFVLGVCVYYMTSRYTWLRRVLDGSPAFCLLGIAIVAACYVDPLRELVFAFLLPLIVRSTHTARLAHWTLGNRPMVFLGDISYAIYLSHQLIREAVEVYVPILPALPVVIAWSAACYFLVERPARELVRRRLARPPQLTA